MLAGIGGYGENYLRELLSLKDPAAALAGIIDPFAENSPSFGEIKAKNIPVFSDIDDFYKNNGADLAVISSPIHTHYAYTMASLSHGSNVLLEKPICGDMDQVNQLVEKEKQSGLFAAVGYQLCYSRNTLALKEDILNGVYGRPLSFKTMCLARRNTRYYRRNKWAGKIRYAGEKVYDSPLNNACSHYLQISLFLLGDEVNRSAGIAGVEAKLWKARPDVENYDAAAVKIKTEKGIDGFFYTAHCLRERDIGPMGEFFFEHGTVYLKKESGGLGLSARLNDGNEKNYGYIDRGIAFQKLYDAIDSVRTGKAPVCTLETAKSHTKCVNMIQGFPVIEPRNVILDNEDPADEYYYIPGLEDEFNECYKKNALPSEKAFG